MTRQTPIKPSSNEEGAVFSFPGLELARTKIPAVRKYFVDTESPGFPALPPGQSIRTTLGQSLVDLLDQTLLRIRCSCCNFLAATRTAAIAKFRHENKSLSSVDVAR
jgi:hypothetical protein